MKSSVEVKRLVVGQMAENCYLVTDTATKKTLIIDPGDDAEYISEILLRENLKPIKIVATHGHFDHVMGVRVLQMIYRLPFLINKEDQFLISRTERTAGHFLKLKNIGPAPQTAGELKDRKVVEVGGLSLTVIATPGHTPGSVSLYSEKEKIIFVGDLIFAGGAVGRTDFSYSNQQDLKESLGKILLLPGETAVYPGHGGKTHIKSLKKIFRV